MSPQDADLVVSTLERLRLERGLSLNDVAKAVPIDRKTLSYLEDGDAVTPRAGTIMRLARFYGVRPDWLMIEYQRDRRRRNLPAAA